MNGSLGGVHPVYPPELGKLSWIHGAVSTTEHPRIDRCLPDVVPARGSEIHVTGHRTQALDHWHQVFREIQRTKMQNNQ